MKELPKLTTDEAKDLILKKLKIKPLNSDNTLNYVRKYNTLCRIRDMLQKKAYFAERYNNRKCYIQEGTNHYWLDLWTDDDLLTFRYRK